MQRTLKLPKSLSLLLGFKHLFSSFISMIMLQLISKYLVTKSWNLKDLYHQLEITVSVEIIMHK